MNTPPSRLPLRFGIVGTGMIAAVIANAISISKNARLIAVSSRRIENARIFATTRQNVEAVEGADALINRADIDALYLATPTVAKEEIALAAIAAGKHVLVDKPFMNHASVLRMTEAADARGLLFMDATHFVHHPRTATIQKAIPEMIGTPRSLHTAFYFPISDRSNIRFDPTQEPTGALGDMAWYSMRAVVEYLRPTGGVSKSLIVSERDPQTTSVIRVSGLIAFEGGEVSTFDAGYTAGTVLLDLQLLGTSGFIAMDDFVLDWSDSFAFKNPGIPTGFFHRSGMAARNETTFIPTPANNAQEITMIENFAELALSACTSERFRYAAASLKTQQYLDALWLSEES